YGLVDDRDAGPPRQRRCGVGAGVVNDDDLDRTGIVLRQQRVETARKEHLLVVGGNDDRDSEAQGKPEVLGRGLTFTNEARRANDGSQRATLHSDPRAGGSGRRGECASPETTLTIPWVDM